MQAAASEAAPAEVSGAVPAVLAQQSSSAMQGALLAFVKEAEVVVRDLTGREPPPDKVASLHYAVQRECAAVAANPQILAVQDTRFVWDPVEEHIVRPALALALGPAAVSASVRPWHELYEGILQSAAVVVPPRLLMEQFRLFQGRVPGFWDRVLAQHQQRQQQDSQRQSAQALVQLAAMSSSNSSMRERPGAYGRPGGYSTAPAAGGVAGAAPHPLFAALRALDVEWAGKPAEERGCQYWSGLDGSCKRGDACTDAASHLPNKPTPWYLARAKVWQQHGGIRNPANGNWALPKLSGVKRPLPGGDAGPGCFQPLG
jgi:hypothetical protein